MAIIRIHTGSDGKSHFEEIVPKFEPRGDKSESAELIPGSGIVIRRFEATRSNPWHHAPGRAAVFTLSGAVDIEIGDGTVRPRFRRHPHRRRSRWPGPRHARGRPRSPRLHLRPSSVVVISAVAGARRGRGWAGAREGSRRPRGTRAQPRGGWAPSRRASSAAASRERVRSTPPTPRRPRRRRATPNAAA